MNKQFTLLDWIYDHKNIFPLKSGKIFQAYQETEGYEARQQNLSELLSKLHDKGLLDKPKYGHYDITGKGENKVLTLRGKDLDEIREPENYSDVVDELSSFFLERLDDEIHQCVAQGSTLEISLEEIDRFNSKMVYQFMRDNFEDFNDAVDEALDDVVMNQEPPEWEFKPDLDYLSVPLKDAKTSEHIGRPVIVEGMIRKTSDIRPKVVSAVFECVQCGDRYEKEQDSAKLVTPYKCDCGSKKFDDVEKIMADSLSFELSQRDEKETKIACSLMGASVDDYTDLMSGKRVKVLGYVKEKPLSKESAKLEVYLEVNSYELTDRKLKGSEYSKEDKREVLEKIDDASDPFSKFYSSLAPTTADRELPKKCLAVSVIGAPELDSKDSEFGRIHMGVMSNPGMGKSGLLKSVRETFNNVYHSTGGNATGTALTGTVEQTDGGEWELVAGKVVFADKGFLQIDEFDKFNTGQLVKLNSAIEEGYFPIDKATKSAELPGRATVMLSGNFTHKLDTHDEPYEALPEKAQGLYDRIPLLCAVTENDDEVTNQVISNYANGPHSDIVEPYFSEKELRIYRNLAEEYSPQVTQEAQKYVKDFYDGASAYSDNDVQGKSMRPLVNLMKITMAMARFDLSSKATEEHARKACKLMRECRESLGLEFGEKPGEKFEQSRRIEDFMDALDELSSGGEGAEIEDLKQKFTSGYDYSSSEFEKVLEVQKTNGKISESKKGIISK